MNVSACSGSNASQTNSTNPFRQRFEDFKTLGKAVQSGDLTSTESAFETVQKDLANDPRIAKSGKSEQIDKDVTALGDAIKSGDAEATKQAFATLAQDLKSIRHGHHHQHVDNDADAAASTGSTVAPTDATATDATSSILDVMA